MVAFEPLGTGVTHIALRARFSLGACRTLLSCDAFGAWLPLWSRWALRSFRALGAGIPGITLGALRSCVSRISFGTP